MSISEMTLQRLNQSCQLRLSVTDGEQKEEIKHDSASDCSDVSTEEYLTRFWKKIGYVGHVVEEDFGEVEEEEFSELENETVENANGEMEFNEDNGMEAEDRFSYDSLLTGLEEMDVIGL
jgi:adenine-specific DNA methylase